MKATEAAELRTWESKWVQLFGIIIICCVDLRNKTEKKNKQQQTIELRRKKIYCRCVNFLHHLEIKLIRIVI